MKIPFIQAEPRLWFAQIEAGFHTKNVTTQKHKFSYIVPLLPASVALEVQDIIFDPPATAPYDKIKEEVIKRISKSEDQKFEQLMRIEFLGDRTPTQFLRSMRALAGDDLSEGMLRRIFVQRLPSWVQPFLSCKKKETSLDKLAEIADQILEHTPANPSVSAASLTQEQSSDQRILDAILKRNDLLEKQVQLLSDRLDEALESKSFRKARVFPPKIKSGTRTSLCWYHYRFGNNATACAKPCNFVKNAEN